MNSKSSRQMAVPELNMALHKTYIDCPKVRVLLGIYKAYQIFSKTKEYRPLLYTNRQSSPFHVFYWWGASERIT